MDSPSRAQEAPRRVLMIEDDPGDARLIREALREAHGPASLLEEASSLGDALPRLGRGDIDVVLLDLTLPDSHGLDTVTRVRVQASTLPIVVLTSPDDSSTARQALQFGAQDYLVKGESSSETIQRAVRYAIERHEVLLELEQTREEQLRLKDHFLSLVSHELRTPLNNLCLSVSNVADGMVGDVSPEQREVLGLALRSADQLTRMIGDILDLARADTGNLSVERKPTDVAAVLRDTLRTMELAARRKGLIVTLDLPEDLPPACADGTRLRQIIANLLDNAVKFTPAGGTIRVAAERSTEAPELCISIADTGAGISAAGLRRVFDRFYQEGTPSDEIERPGLGLGLYICRRLVQLLGGQISVDSRPGAGSVFRFTLPECTPPAREQQYTSPGAAVDAAAEAHRSHGHIGGVVP